MLAWCDTAQYKAEEPGLYLNNTNSVVHTHICQSYIQADGLYILCIRMIKKPSINIQISLAVGHQTDVGFMKGKIHSKILRVNFFGVNKILKYKVELTL